VSGTIADVHFYRLVGMARNRFFNPFADLFSVSPCVKQPGKAGTSAQ
jgi:hypothetical protein